MGGVKVTQQIQLSKCGKEWLKKGDKGDKKYFVDSYLTIQSKLNVLSVNSLLCVLLVLDFFVSCNPKSACFNLNHTECVGPNVRHGIKAL